MFLLLLCFIILHTFLLIRVKNIISRVFAHTALLFNTHTFYKCTGGIFPLVYDGKIFIKIFLLLYISNITKACLSCDNIH